MSKLHYMPWYPSDYIADTRHLSLEEHGAYRLLLDHLWLAGGELEYDEKRLARRLGITPGKFAKLWPEVGQYFRLEGGRISHSRLSAEIEKATEIVKKRKEIARQAAKERWKKAKENSGGDVPEAMHGECQPEPKGSGRTPKGVSTMNLTPDGAAAFDELRAACGNSEHQLRELAKLEGAIRGYADGTFFVSDLWSKDVLGERLGAPLRAARLKLEVQRAEDKTNTGPKLKAINGGKS